MSIFPSPIRPDEEVVLFDTAAAPTPDRDSWVVPVHAWVYESASEFAGGGLVDALAKILELTEDPRDEALLIERGRPFTADDQSWKDVRVRVEGRLRSLPLTDSEGHTRATFRVPRAGGRATEPGEVRAIFPRGDRRRSVARVHFVGPTGVSVISDIDDTVKVSDVADRASLLQNTFTSPFRAVPGMPEVYSDWAQRGAVFHYVSSSPWQLYRPLRAFFAEAGLPAGPMEMKTFSARLSRFVSLFDDPVRTKLPVIESILKAWPQRRFVLVGDSTEKDAEVYAEAARRYPSQVERIWIRRVPGVPVLSGRFESVFAGLPRSVWGLFDDPQDLRFPGVGG